jgi:hypothetical protein
MTLLFYSSQLTLLLSLLPVMWVLSVAKPKFQLLCLLMLVTVHFPCTQWWTWPDLPFAMYSSHCVHTKAIKTTKKIVLPPCTQGDCQSKSFTCSKLWFHTAKDPQNDSYHFSFSLVWPIKRIAESKLYCKKDFHEIIRQCSCLSHTQKHYTLV